MRLECDSDRFAADGGTAFVTERDPDESAIRAVSRSIAAVKGVPETDLDPLYRQVEMEAMNAMIQHADERECSVTIGFTVDGYSVLVSDDGEIRIVPGSLEISPTNDES